jgi:DNA-binding transcriptional LysR family regulator
MNLTLRQLQAFRAVAEDGSFTRAAERLGLAQPALSLLVRTLERELGAKLFDRTTRRVELTEAGREFLADAARVLVSLDLAVRNMRDLTERRRGRLAVAAPPLLSAVVLPGAVADFRQLHPGVRVILIDEPTEGILASVRSGEADLGVGTFAADEQGIARTVLVRDELVLFCARGHPLSTRSPVTWADLAEAPLVTITPGSGIRALVESAFRDAGLHWSPAFEVAHVATAVALAEAGLGVAVLPAYAGAGSAASGRLIRKAIGGPTVVREVALATLRGRSLPPAAATFVPILRSHVQRAIGAAPG